VLNLFGGAAIAVFGLYAAGIVCMYERPADVWACGTRAFAPFLAATVGAVVIGVTAFAKHRWLKPVVALGCVVSLFGVVLLVSGFSHLEPR